MYGDLLDISPEPTEPASEPVVPHDVQKQLENFESDHETFLAELITEAREEVENYTRRSIIPKTLTATYSYGRAFKLYQPPFGSVTSVKSFYEGAETEEDTANFYVRSGLVPEYRLKRNKAWSASRIDEVEIVYTVSGSQEDAIKRAIIQLAAERFMFRVSREVGTIASAEIEPGSWKHTLQFSGLVIPRA